MTENEAEIILGDDDILKNILEEQRNKEFEDFQEMCKKAKQMYDSSMKLFIAACSKIAPITHDELNKFYPNTSKFHYYNGKMEYLIGYWNLSNIDEVGSTIRLGGDNVAKNLSEWFKINGPIIAERVIENRKKELERMNKQFHENDNKGNIENETSDN
jgi:hypothetical protein